jgi:hypothetical protein
LIPPKPISMTVCRYGGVEGTLRRSSIVTGSRLSAFVVYVNLPTWQVIPHGQALNCPEYRADVVDYLQFRYASGPHLVVSVDVGGCPLTSNGSRTIWGAAIGQRLATWGGV